MKISQNETIKAFYKEWGLFIVVVIFLLPAVFVLNIVKAQNAGIFSYTRSPYNSNANQLPLSMTVSFDQALIQGANIPCEAPIDGFRLEFVTQDGIEGDTAIIPITSYPVTHTFTFDQNSLDGISNNSVTNPITGVFFHTFMVNNGCDWVGPDGTISGSGPVNLDQQIPFYTIGVPVPPTEKIKIKKLEFNEFIKSFELNLNAKTPNVETEILEIPNNKKLVITDVIIRTIDVNTAGVSEINLFAKDSVSSELLGSITIRPETINRFSFLSLFSRSTGETHKTILSKGAISINARITGNGGSEAKSNFAIDLIGYFVDAK